MPTLNVIVRTRNSLRTTHLFYYNTGFGKKQGVWKDYFSSLRQARFPLRSPKMEGSIFSKKFGRCTARLIAPVGAMRPAGRVEIDDAAAA